MPKRIGNVGSSFFLSPWPIWRPLSNKQTKYVSTVFDTIGLEIYRAKIWNGPFWLEKFELVVVGKTFFLLVGLVSGVRVPKRVIHTRGSQY